MQDSTYRGRHVTGWYLLTSTIIAGCFGLGGAFIQRELEADRFRQLNTEKTDLGRKLNLATSELNGVKAERDQLKREMENQKKDIQRLEAGNASLTQDKIALEKKRKDLETTIEDLRKPTPQIVAELQSKLKRSDESLTTMKAEHSKVAEENRILKKQLEPFLPVSSPGKPTWEGGGIKAVVERPATKSGNNFELTISLLNTTEAAMKIGLDSFSPMSLTGKGTGDGWQISEAGKLQSYQLPTLQPHGKMQVTLIFKPSDPNNAKALALTLRGRLRLIDPEGRTSDKNVDVTIANIAVGN